MTGETPKTSKPNRGVPYVMGYGVISKALEKIKMASTPERFTQDFLSTKLGLKGGSATPIIPFLKRTGFLNSDGTPTELYKKFRNDALRSAAAAQALKTGYANLYEVNEYVHDSKDADLKGIIVQATGLDAGSSTVKAIIGSFKALRGFANFEAEKDGAAEEMEEPPRLDRESTNKREPATPVDFKLGYTINLNLPATSDIAVFDAIFKSLRKHLLDE